METPRSAPGLCWHFLTRGEEVLGGHLLCASSLPGASAGAMPCTPASGSGRDVLASVCLQAKNLGSEELSAALESGPETRGQWFLSWVHSLVYCFMLWLLTSDSERSSGSFGERNPGKVRGRGGQHLPKPRARRQVWCTGGGRAGSLPGRGKSRREGSEVGAPRVPGKPRAETVA